MRILVTGGCGFIGSHLADALVLAGHVVTILDDLSTGKRSNAPANAELVIGDVADGALVGKLVADSDVVFHLAAVASVERCAQDPIGSHRTNVTGSMVIFDAARAKKIPVIYASSAAVYGDNPKQPLGEDAATQPLSNYGTDKLMLENYALMSWNDYQLPSVGFRFFNVYGPRQDPASPYSGVISRFTACALRGDTITLYGDGEQTRDFIYVGDVVRLLIAALAHVGKGAVIYNGCTGVATSIKKLATDIGELIDKPMESAVKEARVGDIRHSLGSPEKASNELGFRAETTVKCGLQHLLGGVYA